MTPLARRAVGALLAGFAASPALAGETWVEAVGRAPILGGNRSAAEERAVLHARIRAVEESVGARVSSQVLLQREVLTSSRLEVWARGCVKSFEVRGLPWVDPPDVMNVRIRALVSDDRLEDELVRLAERDRVVIATRETAADGSPVEVLAPEAIRLLASAGIRNVIDLRALATREEIATLCGPGETAARLRAARAAGLRHLADAVVFGTLEGQAGSAFGERLWSGHARARLELFRLGDARTLGAADSGAVKAMGDTAARAGRKALEDAASRAARSLVQLVTADDARPVEVVFRDLPDYDSFQRCQATLGEMMGVRSVQAGAFRDGRGSFNLRYSYPLHQLASDLGQLSGYRVTAVETDRVEVAVQTEEP